MISSFLPVSTESDFSLANIPFGVASLKNSPTLPFCVTAIGDHVLNLGVLQDAGAFDMVDGLHPHTFQAPTLNPFLEHAPQVWPLVRQRLLAILRNDADGDAWLCDNEALRKACIYDRDQVQMHLPFKVGEYTDFYSSREHATNVGVSLIYLYIFSCLSSSPHCDVCTNVFYYLLHIPLLFVVAQTMFRGKDNALQPNWLHLPVGYHGRASTVVVSGTPITRPCGQLQKDKDDPKQGSIFGPCRLLDFELEMATVVGGPPNPMGQPLSLDQAKERIFGFLLMNDWSARDIQKWEYVPLGPFTAKNFGTTLSPWIVTTQALQDFVGTTSAGPQQVEPVPLEYLQDSGYSSYDVRLQVQIQGDGMDQAHTVCSSNFLNCYWNAAQQLVHHSVTGCVMHPGDLLGSGTISGQTEEAFGSMLELSWKGTKEVPVGNEVRKFLKDGDTVIMKGWCAKDGHGRVGFGECSGKVLPARNDPGENGSKEAQEDPAPSLPRLKLYSYWRSSSSWRVRIALNSKGLDYDVIPVDLKTGAQKDPTFTEKNPMQQLPVLEYTDSNDGQVKHITQSVAIQEFLDVLAPTKRSLMPKNPMDKVAAMEMVEIINSGIQPLQNAPMVKRLEHASEGKINGNDFANQHIVHGLKGLEQLIVKRRQHESHCGPYCLGNFSPTIVDAFLVPQLYNARRFGVDVEKDVPTLVEIEAVCAKHPWFISAHADVQPDAEK